MRCARGPRPPVASCTAALLVASAFFTGCSTVAEKGSSQARSSSSPTSAAAESWYPFEGLTKIGADQQKAIFDAKEAAIAQCMKSRGFEYLPEPYRAPDDLMNSWGDIAYAREHGYGLNYSGEPDRDASTPTEAPPRNDPSRLPAATRTAWQAALNGASVGDPDAIGKDPDLVEIKTAEGASYFSRSACRTYADEQVQGDEVQWMSSQARVQDLANEVQRTVDADPRIAAKKRDWAECMAGRGYQVTEPETAPDAIMDKVRAGQLDQSDARKQEIAMATADAECVNAVGAPEVRRQVMAEHEKSVLDAHENDIMAFVELQKKAVERATALAAR